MKRILIDGDLCQGTGECAALSPATVTFDATGIAEAVAGHDVLDDDLADRLVATCPSMAITTHPA